MSNPAAIGWNIFYFVKLTLIKKLMKRYKDVDRIYGYIRVVGFYAKMMKI